MLKLVTITAFLFFQGILFISNPESSAHSTDAISFQLKSVYDFKVPALTGDTIDFAAFKGKKILIVNTASKCGFTPQYEELEQLYQKYREQLVVIGFPSNNFLSQEPGSNEKIKEFCTKNYGVSFPMAAKIAVKGKNIAPIYKWLCNKSENGIMDAKITWNFNKFLLDENGKIIAWFPSKVTPMSKDITGKL